MVNYCTCFEEQPLMPPPCVYTGKWCDNNGDCENCLIYGQQQNDD